MPKEIERKFLVTSDAWRQLGTGRAYRQGYLAITSTHTVRVRVVGDQGYLTVKGKLSGITRLEYEYPIPVQEAHEMLNQLCEKPLIEKTRYCVECKGHIWEVDEFSGENQGLVVAEVELESEDQRVELPEWVGQEVSEDSRYLNASLVKNPYSHWSQK